MGPPTTNTDRLTPVGGPVRGSVHVTAPVLSLWGSPTRNTVRLTRVGVPVRVVRAPVGLPTAVTDRLFRVGVPVRKALQERR